MIYLIIYLTSIPLSWITTRLIYSPKGFLGEVNSKPNILDIVRCFLPVINTIWFGVTLTFNIEHFAKNIESTGKDYSKFFKIKNK
jgi:hypothetical protein